MQWCWHQAASRELAAHATKVVAAISQQEKWL
jgi:hypothetical protein